MLYPWMASNGFFAISLIAQSMFGPRSSTGVIVNLLLLFMLELWALCLIAKKTSDPDSRYTVVGVVLWSLYFCVFMLISGIHGIIALKLRMLMFAGSLVIMSAQMVLASSRSHSKARDKIIQRPQSVQLKQANDPRIALADRIDWMLGLTSVQANPAFANTLREIRNTLFSLIKDEIEVSRTLLEESGEVFESYAQLASGQFLSLKECELLIRVEEFAEKLSFGLKRIHENKIEARLDKIACQIDALNSHLEMEGLTPQPFEKR